MTTATPITEADLPSHPEPHSHAWTEAEKRCILAWGNARGVVSQQLTTGEATLRAEFDAWYAEQARTWANNPARKQYHMTVEGVQQALKDASFLAYCAATERAAVLCDAERNAQAMKAAANDGRASDIAFGASNAAEFLAAAIRASSGRGAE
jgi:hypothetical protein